MIGIFDSGIGGVSVLKEILKILPNQKYIYYSDSKNNPYGDIKDDKLYIIVSDVVKYLIDRNCNIIVIACNTASCKCVEKLREEYKDIIFVAIEPAYKMVYDHNYNGKTLLLATKGTIESEKFTKLYDNYNNNNTILKSCVGLAELIEEGNEDKIDEYLKDNLEQYKNIENIVLGCTHYSIIKDNIRKVLGNVNFFEGNKGVSKELKNKLEEINQYNNDKFYLEFIDSSNDDNKKKRFYEILSIEEK